ncbi:MAG: GNAT family N-acetyltransferase [Dysgonomonas sp.]|nr:GNAT family N-acetyltransferase [Dysgonomonas sp.]
MIEKAVKEDYSRLQEIWESAVLATHDFLSEEDFEFYKSNLLVYFGYVDLYIYKDESFVIKGFLGVNEEKIEMLFIENESRGLGIGGKLLKFATDYLKLTKVDVNEQNRQALEFYKKFGFRERGRSLLDSDGKEYPIIFLQLD